MLQSSKFKAWIVGFSLVFVVAFVVPRVIGAVVRERIVAMMSERLHATVVVRSASVGFGGVSLHGVKLIEAPGMELQADAVVVGMRWWSFWGDRSRLIRSVEVDDGVIEIDVNSAWLRDRLSARAARSPAESDAPNHARPELLVSDTRVVVNDAGGRLLWAEIDDARVESSRLQCEISTAGLGEAGAAEHVEVEDIEFDARRVDGVWKLDELNIDEGVAFLAVRGESKDEGVPTLLARLGAVPSALRPERKKAIADIKRTDDEREDEEQVASADDSASITDHVQRLLEWLTPEARVDIGPIDLTSRIGTTREEQLSGLRIRLSGARGDWVRFTGSGSPRRKGALNWAFDINPVSRVATGDLTLQSLSPVLILPLVPSLPLTAGDDASMDGKVHLDGREGEPVHVDVDLQVRGLVLSSERLAPHPVRGLGARFTAQGTWDGELRRLTLPSASVQSAGATVHFNGFAEHDDDHTMIALRANVPTTDCTQLFSALPRDLLGEVGRFRWSGTWAATAEFNINTRALDDTVLRLDATNRCKFVDYPEFANIERLRAPFVHTVEESDDRVFRMTTGPGSANWTPFSGISPFAVYAVLAHEDAGFFRHNGFALFAVRDALVRNLREGRFAVGGSTISMQLAKNLYLSRDKTVMRKAREAFLTWWLEAKLSKPAMLEMYLNIVEFGPATYGIGNASRRYFGRTPAELTPAEAAFLACVLPSPRRFGSKRLGRPSPFMLSRMQAVLDSMLERGMISTEGHAYGIGELPTIAFVTESSAPVEPRELPVAGPVAPSPPSDAYELLGAPTAESTDTKPDMWEPLVAP